MFGMTSALDTLVSQSYGAKEYHLMGLHCQRAVVMLTVFSIPIGYIWCNTHVILHYCLDIDKDTSNLAGEWARYILLGLWPTLMFQIMKKLLQGGGIIWPVIASSVSAAVSNLVSCYVTIHIWQWGLPGAAIAVVISQWVGFVTLLLLVILLVAVSRAHAGDDGIGDTNGTISMTSVPFIALSQNENDDSPSHDSTDTTDKEDTTTDDTDNDGDSGDSSKLLSTDVNSSYTASDIETNTSTNTNTDTDDDNDDDDDDDDETTKSVTKNIIVPFDIERSASNIGNSSSSSLTKYFLSSINSTIGYPIHHVAVSINLTNIFSNWDVFLKLGLPGIYYYYYYY